MGNKEEKNPVYLSGEKTEITSGNQTSSEIIATVTPEDIREFVMTNPDYYIGKFEKAKFSETLWLSWNWNTLFFGPVWYAYRKMYIEAAAIFIGAYALWVLFGFFNIPGSLFVALVIIASIADYLYLRRVKSCLKQAKEMHEESQQPFVKQEGGTSITAACIVAVVLITLAVVSIFDIYNS